MNRAAGDPARPSRVKPMAARPMVDLPAPDSPIRPSTSPRFKQSTSTPLTISFQVSSRPALDLEAAHGPGRHRPRRSLSSCCRSCPCLYSLSPAGLVQEPVDDEVHADRQQRDGAGRQQRCGDVADSLIMRSRCRGPSCPSRRVGGWMPTPRKLSAAIEQEHEAEPEAELGDQRRHARWAGSRCAMIQPRCPRHACAPPRRSPCTTMFMATARVSGTRGSSRSPR